MLLLLLETRSRQQYVTPEHPSQPLVKKSRGLPHHKILSINLCTIHGYLQNRGRKVDTATSNTPVRFCANATLWEETKDDRRDTCMKTQNNIDKYRCMYIHPSSSTTMVSYQATKVTYESVLGVFWGIRPGVFFFKKKINNRQVRVPAVTIAAYPAGNGR